MVYPIDFFHFSHNSTEKTPHQGIKKIDKNQKKLLNFYEKKGIKIKFFSATKISKKVQKIVTKSIMSKFIVSTKSKTIFSVKVLWCQMQSSH